MNNFTIFFRKSDLAWNNFWNINEKSSDNEIKNALIDFYSHDWINVKVEIEWELISVTFLWINHISENQINEISKLAQRWDFERARKKLDELLKQYPTESDLYRLYGQTLSDQWKIWDAEKWLIDCLKYNPDNVWWLVMLWNIYNQQWKKDIAKILYKRALKKNDKDIYALSNYWSLCLELEENNEAKKVLEQALQIDGNYWITNYSLWIVYFREWKNLEAFDFCLKARKNIDKQNPKTQSILKLLINICFAQNDNLDIESLYVPLKEQLEKDLWKNIVFRRDDGIKSLAKIKIAEYYWTQEHIVLFNPQNNGYKYAIMHELVHLKMISEARKIWTNKIISSAKEQEKQLIEDMKLWYMKLWLEWQLAFFAENILTQIYNSPLDLCVENYLYNTYKELRPSQFLFQFSLIMQWIEIAQSIETKKSVPDIIFNANVTMNSILAQQINDLYWIDKTWDFWHNDLVRLGKKLYDKFNSKKDSMKPWDEYELVELRAEKLWYSKYFMIDKEDLNSENIKWRKNIKDDSENFSLDEIESKIKKMWKESEEINMAVVMYCLSAIRFFKNKSKKEIEMIWYELAMKWSQWIKYGEDSKYFINSIPWKQFSWYEFLSYMYVAWQILKPEADLWLDYSKEYELAKQLDSEK